MQIVIEKRSSENLIYDVHVEADLAPTEEATEVTAITVDVNPTSSLTFTAAASWSINIQPITYKDGVVAKIGSVMQGNIGGGYQAGYASYTYTMRIQYKTNINSSPREATIRIKVQDI